MVSSTERTLVLVVAVLATGCVSGHLLDAARRREAPTALAAVALDGPDLVVMVRTETVTDLGRPVGRGLTRARVPLADLARDLPIEALPVRFERAVPPPPGRPLLVIGADTQAPPPFARLTMYDAPALTVRTQDAEYPPLHLDALTRVHYAPWAWAVMPAAVAVDAVIAPPLLLLAPAVMLVGD
jgi:hypothetical protein